MKKVKRILTVLLALVMLVSVAPMAFAAEGFDNFTTASIYEKGQFTDVKEGQWFEGNVITAYELGLIKGMGDNVFGVDEDITLAQTITIACRLHSIYNTGEENFVQEGIWYTVYVDYALTNRIITSEFADYNKPATRAQFAQIIFAALPISAYPVINTVDNNAIPDVRIDDPYGKAVYAFYRAGVLTGNDEKGTFTPSDPIKRSAVSAIISRAAVPSMRVEITLTLPNENTTTADLATMREKLDLALGYAKEARKLFIDIPDVAKYSIDIKPYFERAEGYNIQAGGNAQLAANPAQKKPELLTYYNETSKARAYCVQANEAMQVLKNAGYEYDAENQTHVDAYIKTMQFLTAAVKSLEKADAILATFES